MNNAKMYKTTSNRSQNFSYRFSIKTGYINFFLVVFLFFGVFFTSSAQERIVVIDAGHGGKDPGTLGQNSKEKDIALSIALKVGNYLSNNTEKIKVIYTRKTDTFIPLYQRARIANRAKADLFISIHVNWIANKSIVGTETYVMELHKSDKNLEIVKTENSVILYEKNYKNQYFGFEPDSPETYIVLSLYQNAFIDMSLNLAEKIQQQFSEKANRGSLGVKQAPFLVLWQTTMPSVLTEVGFISNKEEEIYLNTQYGQDLIASAIYRAIKDYFNEY